MDEFEQLREDGLAQPKKRGRPRQPKKDRQLRYLVDGEWVYAKKAKRQRINFGIEANIVLANKIIEVVDDLYDYWPLSVRQVYYRCVGTVFPENVKASYDKLISFLKYLRLDGYVPWGAIEDRTRYLTDKWGYTDHREYLEAELEGFLTKYNRCPIQGQEMYVEIWSEKHAIAPILHRAANEYCVQVLFGRGYSSATATKDFAARARSKLEAGLRVHVLHFGDYDPSGKNILEAAIQTLEDEHGLLDDGIIYERVAVNPSQIEEYQLPTVWAKQTDSRTKHFISTHGGLAIEVDAIHPQVLEQIVAGKIHSIFNMEDFSDQLHIEQMEQKRLAGIRAETINYVSNS